MIFAGFEGDLAYRKVARIAFQQFMNHHSKELVVDEELKFCFDCYSVFCINNSTDSDKIHFEVYDEVLEIFVCEFSALFDLPSYALDDFT